MLRPGRNTGFAGGNNLALRDLDGVDYVALLNNDAFVEPGWLEPLVAALEAGLSFAQSLRLASTKVKEPLAGEVRLTLQEQNMGLTLVEALGNFLARIDTVGVRMFARSIAQGETLAFRNPRDLLVDEPADVPDDEPPFDDDVPDVESDDDAPDDESDESDEPVDASPDDEPLFEDDEDRLSVL